MPHKTCCINDKEAQTSKYNNTTVDTIAACTVLINSEVTPPLKLFLKRPLRKDTSCLYITNEALVANIKDTVKQATILHYAKTQTLFCGICMHMDELFEIQITGADLKAI